MAYVKRLVEITDEINAMLKKTSSERKVTLNDEIDLARTVISMFKDALNDVPRFNFYHTEEGHVQIQLVGDLF